MSNIKAYIKYSNLLVSKNLLFFLLVLIQLIIMSFCISFSIVYVNSQNTEMNYSKKLNINNAVYFSGNNEILENELKDVNMIIKQFTTTSSIDSKTVKVVAGDEAAYKLVDIPLYKGRWFRKDSNEIEVVISQKLNYKIGDRILIRINNNELRCKIVGLLPNRFCSYRLSGGSSIGDNMTTKFLFEPSDDLTNYLYISINSVKKYINNFSSGSVYINFLPSISNDTLQDNYNILRNNGHMCTIQKMIENSKLEYNRTTILMLQVIVMLSILILISSIFIICIICIKAKKLFAILYLNGANIKDIRLIIMIFGIYLISFAFASQILIKKIFLDQVIKNYGKNFIDLIILPALLIIYLSIINIISNKYLSENELINSLKEKL